MSKDRRDEDRFARFLGELEAASKGQSGPGEPRARRKVFARSNALSRLMRLFKL